VTQTGLSSSGRDVLTRKTSCQDVDRLNARQIDSDEVTVVQNARIVMGEQRGRCRIGVTHTGEFATQNRSDRRIQSRCTRAKTPDPNVAVLVPVGHRPHPHATGTSEATTRVTGMGSAGATVTPEEAMTARRHTNPARASLKGTQGYPVEG
jgi:hypothetical protein